MMRGISVVSPDEVKRFEGLVQELLAPRLAEQAEAIAILQNRVAEQDKELAELRRRVPSAAEQAVEAPAPAADPRQCRSVRLCR